MSAPRVYIEEIAGLCQREWGLGQITAVVRLSKQPGSTALYRVIADDRRFLFKEHLPVYDLSDLERIAHTTEFLAEQGFPTPRYHPTASGKVAADARGARCTLRPWVEGEPLERANLTSPQIASLGQTLGWCHRLLTALPPGDDFNWAMGLPRVIDELDQLTARIVARLEPAESDSEVLHAIATQRAILQRAGDLAALHASCPIQVAHGDYHVENVLFGDSGALSGVIDVEGWTAQRVREVYRAIAWSQRQWNPPAIDLPLARAFVQGYAEEAPLTAEELRVGPEVFRWRLLRGMHDLRTYADDPQNHDARDGVLWFMRMAQWLAQHGRELGEELAGLAK